MRRLLPLLLLVAGCNDRAPFQPPPMDSFYFPSGLALTAPAGGNQTLLVASSNFDLQFLPGSGGTLLAVDPRPATEGGSAVAGGNLLDGHLLGPGARLGSFTGPLVLVDGTSCPGAAAALPSGKAALTASRFNQDLQLVGLLDDGSVEACGAAGCGVPLDGRFLDPYAITLACRADGARRSAFVGYLRTPPQWIIPPVVPPAPALPVFIPADTGWVTEVDLDDPGLRSRSISLVPGPVGAMAYDATADQLYLLGHYQTTIAPATAPVTVFDLSACRATDPTCPLPASVTVDLFPIFHGIDLQQIVLSTVQPGLSRRAYVLARLFDADQAAVNFTRPTTDLGGVLLVLDLTPGPDGHPLLTVLRAVQTGIGPGDLKLLPARPGQRDLMVVTSSTDGVLWVYDDDQGTLVRNIPVDPGSGTGLIGRDPYALAVEPAPHLDAAGVEKDRVYVASFLQDMVSIVDVPVLDPGQADIVRDAAGQPLRIGPVQYNATVLPGGSVTPILPFLPP